MRENLPLTEARFLTDGVHEIDVTWVAQTQQPCRLVDIREASELAGPEGYLPHAEHVPLATLGTAAEQWDPQEPIAILCRSGARSAYAAALLERAGFAAVASVQGGILAWRAQGHPISFQR